MKRLLMYIMTYFCITSLYAQCEKKCLYDSLIFINGRCEKELIVSFLSYGKNPLIDTQSNDKKKIKRKIKRIPNSSVSFIYKGDRYYISVDNKCDLSRFSKGDTIMVKIVFFKDIKQPHKYENYFSLIKKIKLYSPISKKSI